MPGFHVKVCTSFRDVPGLIGSFSRDDIIEDPENEGHVLSWRNRAPGLPSLPLIRTYDQVPSYKGGRCEDFQQRTRAMQPELFVLDGQRVVKFSRDAETFLTTSLPHIRNARGSAIAFQFAAGDPVGKQVIYDDQQNVQIAHRDETEGGFAHLKFGAVDAVGTGALENGLWLVNANASEVRGTLNYDASSIVQSGDATFLTLAGQLAYLGRDAAGNYLDGYLSSFHIWANELSPRTRDFVWSTLDESDANFASGTWAKMTTRKWTDITGVAGSSQINRIRTESSMHPYYTLAFLEGQSQRVLILVSENGMVLSDDDPESGSPFEMTWVETPGVFPPIYREAGWSKVFEVSITRGGHYVARVSRANQIGGVVFLHFDVEVIP